jgi:hypothetical protein
MEIHGTLQDKVVVLGARIEPGTSTLFVKMFAFVFREQIFIHSPNSLQQSLGINKREQHDASHGQRFPFMSMNFGAVMSPR